MKFSKQWLGEWLSSDISVTDLAQQLTALGLEVDTVEPASGDFTGVLVGRIESAEQHPDADRLRCCRVDVGQEQLLDIVCGGVNARAGIKVPVAIVGAILPGDFKIKATKLRGQPSSGMICSSNELGLGEELSPAGGIMELSSDAPVGEDFFKYMKLDDHIIDIELTPNRGDCACLHGIAREIVLLQGGEKVVAPYWSTITDLDDSQHSVTVQAPALCSRYCSRVIHNIDASARTPLWIQERLRRSGLRSLHPVVDVLNYVMLETGQPMHSFDYDRLKGDVIVRRAVEGEKMTLLDGREILLDIDSLLVADESGPLALAGIMGGSESSVNDSTKHILLESAFFDPVSIRRTAAIHNLKTDSSYRFERGVDYQLQKEALERATTLLVDIIGGQVGAVHEVINQEHHPQSKTIQLRYEQVERLLGVSIPKDKVLRILSGLGFVPLNENTPWHFRIPSFRFDCEQEIDLVEECARVYGFDNIPLHSVSSSASMTQINPLLKKTQEIMPILNSLGYSEVITYSFVDPQWQSDLLGEDKLIHLKNPISQDLSVMRLSCWPGLLKLMQYNLNRQYHRVRIFEIGKVFSQSGEVTDQSNMLSLLAYGAVQKVNWRSGEEKMSDFYSVKGDIDGMLKRLNIQGECRWQAGKHRLLHPGQCAELLLDNRVVGVLGALHPQWLSEFGIANKPVLFELNLDLLSDSVVPQFESLPRFPAMKRDLAILVDETVTADRLLAEVQEASDNILNKVEIFDVYQGEGIEIGKKSVALGLTFLDRSRTLIESEVDNALEKILNRLSDQLSATMRG